MPASSAVLQLIPGQFITLAVSTIFTATTFPINAQVQITSMLICNTTGADHTFRLFNVPKGGSAAQSNAFFYDNNLPAATTWFVTVGGDGVEILTIPAGGFIAASAAVASAITITASGRVYT
jgi:hypothetical protein